MSTQPKVIKESRTAPLIFDQLEQDGSNYTDWNFNIHATLASDELDVTLEPHPEEDIPAPYLWQAIMIMRRHMDPALCMQYIAEENPARLWPLGRPHGEIQARRGHISPTCASRLECAPGAGLSQFFDTRLRASPNHRATQAVRHHHHRR